MRPVIAAHLAGRAPLLLVLGTSGGGASCSSSAGLPELLASSLAAAMAACFSAALAFRMLLARALLPGLLGGLDGGMGSCG